MLILFLVCILLMVHILSGCAFRPVQIEGIPQECNMAYSAMRLTDGKNIDKSIAVIPMERCAAVLMRDRCRNEVYGKDAPVDYRDASKYRDYTQCMSELK